MSVAAPRPPDTIVGRLVPSDPATVVRPLAPADEQFCRALFHEDRAARFASLGASGHLLATMLDQQFRAQQTGYGRSFPHAEHLLIEHVGAAVGRLIVAVERAALPMAATDETLPEGSTSLARAGDRTVHLVDIVLAAAARGHGIGTDVINSLLRAAAGMGATRLTLAVLQTNDGARRLYERLGFVATTGGSHIVMVKSLP
ncbi:MAG: GNAT family N-acetyltransferase [Rhodoplanes sp.]|uniref:GNAT family N-acetyltransferase n=1 Tax=Rhodoplanes sp. TaxID=1968906 RepID=UPI0017A50FF5|nr:GNAT family N-acetyltransferase [Rhodoplanes sp.]NVO13402.1 GNAT family N-acetyltransferase [Rhodoplanes sp.]